MTKSAKSPSSGRSRAGHTHTPRWQTPAEVAAHRKAQSKYEATPDQIKKRGNRTQARRVLEREGKVHKGDGKDVMHVDGNALHNSPSNWKVGSEHKNRSYARTKGAHKVNPRS